MTVFIPYLDMLQSEISKLFERHQAECLKLQCVVPKYLRKAAASFRDIAQAVEFYSDDLTGPSSMVEAEFEQWKKKWSQVPLAVTG